MRRIAFVLILGLTPRGAALAQTRPEVVVEYRTAGQPGVTVQLRALLADQRFVRAMESGFPLYLEYELELRESRSFWDRTVRSLAWEYVVLYDPVREVFAVEDQDGGAEYSSETSLQRRLNRVYVIPQGFPSADGTYYYKASVNARTLSDEDVDEVYAWLHGANGDSARHRRPGLVTRTARRLLQRVAPLPRERYEGRTRDVTPRGR